MVTDPDVLASLQRRFWSYVSRANKHTTCWNWKGAKKELGYGVTYDRGRLRLAPRVAWFLATGEEPGNKFVCHHCDNPSCVRPSHLFLGTAAENLQDAIRKGRFRLWRGEIPLAEAYARKLAGESNRSIARSAGLTHQAVIKALRRFAQQETCVSGAEKS